jgi:DNA-binding CsgD family transcriptional regulator
MVRAWIGVGVLKTYCNRFRATSDLCSLLEQAKSSKPRIRLPKREMGKSTRKLSLTVAAEIVELYQNGIPAHQIAERLNIHRITVSNYLDRFAVAKRPKGLTDQQTDEAVLAYEAGDSFATIGRRLGFSPMTISLALRRQGVAIRQRPGRS